MFPTPELTTRVAGTEAAQAAAMAVPSAIFPRKHKGWSGLEPSLTCRQGDFGEDLSDEGKQTQASGIG
jgi:hypothetical protein